MYQFSYLNPVVSRHQQVSVSLSPPLVITLNSFLPLCILSRSFQIVATLYPTGVVPSAWSEEPFLSSSWPANLSLRTSLISTLSPSGFRALPLCTAEFQRRLSFRRNRSSIMSFFNSSASKFIHISADLRKVSFSLCWNARAHHLSILASFPSVLTSFSAWLSPGAISFIPFGL